MKCQAEIESEYRFNTDQRFAAAALCASRSSLPAPGSEKPTPDGIGFKTSGIALVFSTLLVLGIFNLSLNAFEAVTTEKTLLRKQTPVRNQNHSSRDRVVAPPLQTLDANLFSGMTSWLLPDNRIADDKQCAIVNAWLAARREWPIDTHPLDELDRVLLEEIPSQNGLLLHQTWKTTCIPSAKNEAVKSWLEKDANIRIVFWEDEGMDTWVRVHFANTDVERLWDLFGGDKLTGVKRADFFRLLTMFYYAGLYMDLDVMALRSWQPLLDEFEALVAWEPDWSMEKYGWVPGEPKTHLLVGLLAASRRFHPFFEYALLHVIDMSLDDPVYAQGCHPVDCTGPKAVAGAFAAYTGVCHDKSLHDLENRLINTECDECFANHLGGCTWCDDAVINSCTSIEELVPKDRLVLPREYLL